MKRSLRVDFSPLESDINLTPLIDVVFVLLISFILIAPLLELDHVALADGAGLNAQANSATTSSVMIYVRHDDTIWFQDKKVSALELTRILQQHIRQHPASIPLLFQDRKAHFEAYQNVKNAVETAGYTQMDVVLKPH